MTLTNLEKVSASLGAKGILWERFSFNPPTLRLYVELCAHSQFLSEILINNPGMIDDLMDSLVVDRPQTALAIKAELGELCRGAEDLSPILLSFRNKEWVRIGTRDILGRELNYHSDLDLIFVHEGDGFTEGGNDSVPNEVFVTEVIRRILKMLAGTG